MYSLPAFIYSGVHPEQEIKSSQDSHLSSSWQKQEKTHKGLELKLGAEPPTLDEATVLTPDC